MGIDEIGEDMNIEEIRINDEHTIEDFLQPISSDLPAGISLKSSPAFAEIQAARASDNPNMPRGDWDHDLKKSDWLTVSKLTQSALITKTKDVQIAIWLLEAEVSLHGIVKLPACLLLLAELTDKFWDHIHPLMEGGDVEYRTNLFDWMNSRINSIVRHLPIANPISDEVFTWIDWERAQAIPLGKTGASSSKGGPSAILLRQAMDQTNISFYRDIWQDISDCVVALEHLEAILENRLGSDGPSFAGVFDLLKSVQGLVFEVAGGRDLEREEEVDTSNEASDGPDFGFTSESDYAGTVLASDQITDRMVAYSMLAEAAEFLLRDDPHSPVPYLVYKAIEWGRLSTAELYEEIFIRQQGSLNIFDILGIENTDVKKK